MKDVFHGLSKILFFVLGETEFNQIYHDIFCAIDITWLQTNNFLQCCTVPSITLCSAQPAWYESWQRLLSKEALRMVFIAASCLIFTLNLCSLIFQNILSKKWPDKIKSYRIVVSVINAAEILSTTSLIIILAADEIYGEKFQLHLKEWKSNSFCFTVFTMFLLNNLASPCFLCFFALMRFFVVHKPMSSRFKSGMFVTKWLVSFVFSLILMSLGLTALLWGVEGKSLSDLCSPFIDPTDSSVIIFVFTWLVTIFQCVAVGFVLICNCNLVISLNKSKKVIQEAVSKKDF